MWSFRPKVQNYQFDRRRKRSTSTATKTTAPMITLCQKPETFISTVPLDSTASSNAPITVPTIEPCPPRSEVPPRIAAVEPHSVPLSLTIRQTGFFGHNRNVRQLHPSLTQRRQGFLGMRVRACGPKNGDLCPRPPCRPRLICALATGVILSTNRVDGFVCHWQPFDLKAAADVDGPQNNNRAVTVLTASVAQEVAGAGITVHCVWLYAAHAA